MASSPPLTLRQRRRARRMAYWNAGLWAWGNGLSSTTLVVYLAMELGAPHLGIGIALILSARHFVGVLRLGTPALLAWIGNRKRFCIGAYTLSGLLLWTLLAIAAPGVLPSAGVSLAALVGVWCVHHLMQYLGTIALYSWLADLVPLRVRGRFFGRRGIWLVLGEATAALAAGLFVWWWQAVLPASPRWQAYAIPAALGAALVISAVIPLGLMPDIVTRTSETVASWKRLLRPLTDKHFLLLLLFSGWFSFSNGITGTLQLSYPKQVLNVGLDVMLWLQTMMYAGQMVCSAWLGRVADRVGNRPMMLACLLLTAQGPLFYFFSTAEQWWWFIGAWGVWIAYAGLNVGLPNLTLKLAPPSGRTEYLAVYFTVSGLAYASNTLLGGYLFDCFSKSVFLVGGYTFHYDQMIFLLGWIARCLGLVFLWWVIEPPLQKPGCPFRLRGEN
jgi:hypothetical protein